MQASFNTFANSHQNAIEAIQARGGADGRVEIDFKEFDGVNKLRITDNGIAMTRDEVRGEHKPALGINRHTGSTKNFGIGAKITAFLERMRISVPLWVPTTTQIRGF